MEDQFIKKFLGFLEFTLLFTIFMGGIYLLELTSLIIKNIINGLPIFDFPIGIIYVGFL
jgi:hypothetical protein